MLGLNIICCKRFFRSLGTVLLSGLVLFVAFALLDRLQPVTQVARAAPTAQNPVMSVTFSLDDFDDAVTNSNRLRPRGPNNFFASQGPYTIGTGVSITDSLTCPYTHSCHLSLAYDVSASPASEAGYVEELAFSYTYNGSTPATWKLRDLHHCEAFTFRVKGDDTLPFTTRFDIEFVGQNWSVRDRFTITEIDNAGWQTQTILLANLTNVSPTQIKQVHIRLHNSQVTASKGLLHFDDFAFTGCQVEGDLLDVIERQSFAFFWETRHPDTGFVPDRAVAPFYSNKMSSIAGIGYELAALGIGAERGWITRSQAASATLQVLDTLWAITPTASHNGFYYHFLDIDTGDPHAGSEVSTIDTALLMAGVIFAQEYFTGTDATEIAIRQRAGQLFNNVEWTWIHRTELNPPEKSNQFYLAWQPVSGGDYQYPAPDGGYFNGSPTYPTTWDYYTDEILLINLLAIGSPSHAVPTDTFTAWRREQGTYDGYTLYTTWFGQLFAHFIGQGWLDFRCWQEADSKISWVRNSGQAALANRQFVIDQALTYTTYSSRSWGLSPGLGPPNDPHTAAIDGAGLYMTYAGLPRGLPLSITEPVNHDGTVSPYAAAGSIVFLGYPPSQNEAYQALEYWYFTQPRLWGLYGFTDGFNLGTTAGEADDWFAHDYLSLDQGMTLVALENYQTGLVWQIMNRSPIINQSRSAVFKPACHYLPVIFKNSS